MLNTLGDLLQPPNTLADSKSLIEPLLDLQYTRHRAAQQVTVIVKNRRLGNKYEIVERLGRGGTAEVFRAHHLSLGRFVAIKILHDFLADDPEFKTRFEREARNIARLKHPNIVQVYDFEFDAINECYYMVMELVEGANLKDLLLNLEREGRPINLLEGLRIIREAATALAYAHAAGMIHRDVKPANLILDAHDNNRVVLTDFGIAKMVTSAQFTITGGLIGTPAYMSPEQGVGETGDLRSDIYSLGVILYQLLTGELPYNADTPLAIILKHLNDPIPSACQRNAELPIQADELIAKMLAKEPDNRYQQAEDLIADIKALETNPKPDHIITQLMPSSGEASVSKPDAERVIGELTQPHAPQNTIEAGSGRVFFWVASVAFIILVTGIGYTAGVNSGRPPKAAAVLATETATDTPTPIETATNAPTATETPTETATSTPSPTQTATAPASYTPTLTPTATETEAVTPSPTPNSTQTLAVASTATYAVCIFDYAIIEQDPKDGEAGDFFPINTPYERRIVLLNTGTCPWERNTSLAFVNGSGESFSAGPRIFIREPVAVGAEIELIFSGTLPGRGSLTPIAGDWQLRTPGQIPIGTPMTISVFVFDPGGG